VDENQLGFSITAAELRHDIRLAAASVAKFRKNLRIETASTT